MNIIKPLQLMAQQRVIEQDNRFHLVVSATLGVRLETGATLLEMGAMSESIEAMGATPVPDMGMPKPKAEYLVSGKYFSPQGEEVRGGEVTVEFNQQSKSLYVFGDRSWEMGVPSQPDLITEMPLDYSRAFGGAGYDKNPVGMGYQQEILPNIELPDQLISSANNKANPAGLGMLDQMAEQRTQYHGTYDDDYLQKYFPGYPPDFDWHNFMCGASDQWSEDYYVGNETFALHNMHAEKPLIAGQLPGYVARCFAQMENRPGLSEISLNLDTVWFFPEKELVLLTWRGGVEVNDDEAEAVEHIMLAYENSQDTRRELSHYETTFENLLNSKDPLLSQMSSDGIIPCDALCAMEIMQANALQDSVESEFGKNLDAKAKSTAAITSAKVEESIKEMKSSLPADAPEEAQNLLKLEQMLKNPAAPVQDKDALELNNKLEKILPGITAGDAKKLQMKGFTFDKIDEIMLEIEKFQQGKQALAMEHIEKSKDEMRKNLDDQLQSLGDVDDEATKKLKETLSQLNEIQNTPRSPLPRVDATAILAELDSASTASMEAMQNLENMKSMGTDEETIRKLEALLNQSTTEQDQAAKERIEEIEREFKLMYRDSAHFMDDGVLPHKVTIEERKQAFLDALKSAKGVRGQDWSGIDLSGMILDDVDLSDAYLEQVNFSGASLQRANLSGAILARANLASADFSGSNFDNANIGAVSANAANFTQCSLNFSKLSKGNFSGAVFKNARLDSVETLEIIIDQCDFSESSLLNIQFIKTDMNGVSFSEAKLPSVAFLECQLAQCDFNSADLSSSVWADCLITRCAFDNANMSAACFASTDPEVNKLDEVSFVGSCLDKANFQNINMQRADLSSASMIYANFSSANLSAANLSNAIAHNAVFRKAVLSSANMEKIDLREGILTKAHMTGANLSGANLYSVDFLRATMGETIFNGSNLDNTIIQDWRPS